MGILIGIGFLIILILYWNPTGMGVACGLVMATGMAEA